MDAFFASVEQRDHPELRGLPVIIGGSPQRRGVVSTCSYEARAFGVHSAMSSHTAKRLCPQAVFIEPDHRKYCKISQKIRQLFFSITPSVEPMSIDEAYLDVTTSSLHLESAVSTAEYLQKQIFETTGLTASAGVSYNKFLAKIASDYKKPAGLTVITPEEAEQFLDKLPVEKFHGIGSVSSRRLKQMNIRTGHDLKQLSLSTLTGIFGKSGSFYYGIVRGIDDRPVELNDNPKSISRETTLYSDCSDLRQIRILLRTLARKVARRAARHGLIGKAVFIKLKYSSFHNVTRNILLPVPTGDGKIIGDAAIKLLSRTEAGKQTIRLAGVGLAQLCASDAIIDYQPELDFSDS